MASSRRHSRRRAPRWSTRRRQSEAKKLAYADMIRYDADPHFSRIPVDGLKSKAFAKTRAALVDAAKASCHVDAGTPPGTDNGTTYLSVVDREGNMVSLIQSNR